MIRVGLIGFGMAGQLFHAPFIRAVDGLQLDCILERSSSVAQQKYPDVFVARTMEEFLARNTDLCVVATPNTSHFPLGKQCLLAGRHVVIDKPFVTNTKDGAEIIALEEKQSRLLAVYQNRRWDGDFQTVRKVIASGVLGEIISYTSHFDRFRTYVKENAWRERPEPGSGILFDLGTHLLDQAITCFGKPLAVSGDVFTERKGGEVDDAFDVRLEYSGMRAHVRSSMIACAPGPRFALHGTRGSFVKYGMDPQEDLLKQGIGPVGTDWGEDAEANWGTLTFPDGDARRFEKVKTERGDYRGFYENVRDAILGKAPLAVPAKDALHAIRAVELARTSSEERRVLPWSDFPC